LKEEEILDNEITPGSPLSAKDIANAAAGGGGSFQQDKYILVFLSILI
jgi:hypothetical protein